MYIIKEWIERYEVTKDGSAVKIKGQKLRKSPLEYVRWKVNGRKQGIGYRRLIERSKGRAMEVLGIFGKLLEIAADNEPESRGKVLNEKNEPATAEDIAFILSVSVCKIRKALVDLEYLGWIEDVEEVQISEVSAKKATVGEFAENIEPFKNETKRNENETQFKRNENEVVGDTGKKRTEPKKGLDFDISRDSNSIRLDFDSKLRRILPPTSKSDNIAYRNLGIWLARHNGSSRGLAAQALQIAGESQKGERPIALFFDLLKQRMSYNAAAEKEKKEAR